MTSVTTTTAEAPMFGQAGVVDGKLVLSQGIERVLSTDGVSGNFDTIPVVDLSPLLDAENQDPAALAKLTEELRDACSCVGFFVVRNHGVDWKVVEDAFAASREFFGLPLASKTKVHQNNSASFMGYEPAYYTNVDRLKKGDLKESMTTGYEPELDPEGAGYQPEMLLRPNQWPDEKEAPLFKPAMRAYRAACLNLVRKLCRAMIPILGVKEDFFDQRYTYPVAGIRALYYPPQQADDTESTGLGAHTDVQFLTLIAQDPYDVQCLEVLNSSGHWIKPQLMPQTFVVNVGDILGRLTNDTFQSTVHRVRNISGRERYSLPFFFGLNNDELISPLPKFVTPETPVRSYYETPMTAYEHYNRRMRRAHHKHPTAGDSTMGLPRGMNKINGVLVDVLPESLRKPSKSRDHIRLRRWPPAKGDIAPRADQARGWPAQRLARTLGMATNGPRRPRSRRNRPCDLCRVRKIACKITVAPPCAFCSEKGRPCTFDQAPGPRKRHRPGESADVLAGRGGLPRPLTSDSIHVHAGAGEGHTADGCHGSPDRDLDGGAVPVSEVPISHPQLPVPSLPPQSTGRPLGGDRESLLNVSLRYVGPSGDLDPFLLAHRAYDDHHASVSRYTQATYHRMSTLEDGPHGLLPPAVFTSAQTEAEAEVEVDVDVDADAEEEAECPTARAQFEQLVDTITASGLIALYLRFVHPYLPIISRRQLPPDEDGIPDMPVCLLSAICATAIPFVLYDDALCVEAARIPSQEALFALAQRSLAETEGRRGPSLPAVQARLLVLVRHQRHADVPSPSSDARVWAQCCQLVAAAQVLGLNEDPSGWTALAGWERRLRRRLWWAVWTTEKWIAFGQGMPSHLHARGFTQRPLAAADLVDETTGTDDLSLHFLAFVALTGILDDVSESFFTIRATARTVENLHESLLAAKTFRHRLKLWHRDLPESLRSTLQRGKPGCPDDPRLAAHELNGDASLGIAFFATQLAIFRALIRPISMNHLQTTSHCPGSPASPSASASASVMTQQFITATLTGAMSSLRDLIGFVEHLTTAEWDAFWPGWSRHNFALASTLLMHCHLITSPSNQYIGDQKHHTPVLSPLGGDLASISSPESEMADGRVSGTGITGTTGTTGVTGVSPSLYADIRMLAQKWRWLLRLAARGAAGKKNLIDISLLRIDALFTEWNQAQIRQQSAH